MGTVISNLSSKSFRCSNHYASWDHSRISLDIVLGIASDLPNWTSPDVQRLFQKIFSGFSRNTFYWFVVEISSDIYSGLPLGISHEILSGISLEISLGIPPGQGRQIVAVRTEKSMARTETRQLSLLLPYWMTYFYSFFPNRLLLGLSLFFPKKRQLKIS